MPKYSIFITKTAQKQLDKLPDDVADILIEAIQELADDPRPSGCKKLKGRDGFRIRKGNYRIIYDVFDEILMIEVVALGHRKDIYN
ncbi:MAG: type II toxin-antitoxin system RelE family toxin [Saprospiraceae bacterium]